MSQHSCSFGRKHQTRSQSMMALKKIVTGALFLGAAAIVPATQADAAGALGFSFNSGDVRLVLGSPCYGSPACSYPGYSAPVFIEGEGYPGPSHYRWDHGRPL